MDWIELFTRFFPDEQILKPSYAISFGHCKLCDSRIVGETEKAHLGKHRRELREYRKRQARQRQSVQATNLAKARKARTA